MPDLAELKAAVDAAQAAHDELVEERRANRESMTKAEFRAYNQETRAKQIEIQKAVSEAAQALQGALNNARQNLLVEALGESGGQS